MYLTSASTSLAPIVLLRHTFRLRYIKALLPQQGHRGSVAMSAMINLTCMVAIELATWRSGRKGRSSGSIIVG
jgi:hypothetical protein